MSFTYGQVLTAGRVDSPNWSTWTLRYVLIPVQADRLDLVMRPPLQNPRYTVDSHLWQQKWVNRFGQLVGLVAAGAGFAVGGAIAGLLSAWIPFLGTMLGAWILKGLLAVLASFFASDFIQSEFFLPLSRYSLCPPSVHGDCPAGGATSGCPNRLEFCVVVESRFASIMFALDNSIGWFMDDTSIRKNIKIEVDYQSTPCSEVKGE